MSTHLLRHRLLHEISNPKYAFATVTSTRLSENGFFFGFAARRDGETVYFRKNKTEIWVGPWAIKSHPVNVSVKQGHVLFGEVESHPKGPRFKWWVSGLELSRFASCLKTVHYRTRPRPTSAVANAMLAILHGDQDPGKALDESQRKQLAHMCCVPLDSFIV